MHPLDRYQQLKQRMHKEIGQHQQRRRRKKLSKQTKSYDIKNGQSLEPVEKPKKKYVPPKSIAIEPDNLIITHGKLKAVEPEIKWWSKIKLDKQGLPIEEINEPIKETISSNEWWKELPDIVSIDKKA